MNPDISRRKLAVRLRRAIVAAVLVASAIAAVIVPTTPAHASGSLQGPPVTTASSRSGDTAEGKVCKQRGTGYRLEGRSTTRSHPGGIGVPTAGPANTYVTAPAGGGQNNAIGAHPSAHRTTGGAHHQGGYDLALDVAVVPDQDGYVDPGDQFLVSVLVTNEGNISSGTHELTLYIAEGTGLNNNPAWTDNGDGTATLTKTIEIGPGESVTYVAPHTAYAPGPFSIAGAEVSTDDGDDIDSTPDAVNDDLETEDDHDLDPLPIRNSFDSPQAGLDPEEYWGHHQWC